MRTAFIETLCELAATDHRIWLLTGDLGYSVLERFAARFPERFVNVGVAEQNMIGIAAGLALCGKIVFTYSIATFSTMRCLEQIRNDVCHHNANVKIIAVGGGLAYGPAGHSHHSIEDIALMRAMPNMTVVAPGDPVEVRLATRAIVKQAGPSYLRLGKGGEPVLHVGSPEFELGKAIRLRAGDDVTFIAAGPVLAETLKAATVLAERGVQAGVLSMHTITPLDTGAVRAAAKKARLLVTVEEHIRAGGLGGAVAEALAGEGLEGVRHVQVGVTRTPGIVGSQAYLRQHHGLDAAGLARLVSETMGSQP